MAVDKYIYKNFLQRQICPAVVDFIWEAANPRRPNRKGAWKINIQNSASCCFMYPADAFHWPNPTAGHGPGRLLIWPWTVRAWAQSRWDMLESEPGKENGKCPAHLLLPSVTYNVLWDGIEQNFGVSTPFLWKVNFIYIRNFVFQTFACRSLVSSLSK